VQYVGRNSQEAAFRELWGEACGDECVGDWDIYYAPGGFETANQSCPRKPCPGTGNPVAHLLSVQGMLESLVERGVEGDVMEAGVYRGGFVVYMRAVLDSLGEQGRMVVAADSFSGIPEGVTLGRSMDDMLFNEENPDEIDVVEGEKMDWVDRYVAGEEVLKERLREVGLGMSGVRTLPGYFNETLSGYNGKVRAWARSERPSVT